MFQMKNIVLLSLGMLSLLSCTTRTQMERELEATKVSMLTPDQVEFEKNYEIKPGEVRRIRFPHFYQLEDGELKCKNTKVPFYASKGMIEAYIAETYFSNQEPFECVYGAGKYSTTVAVFQVQEKQFPSETLNVDMRRVVLADKDKKRVQEEQKFLNSVYAASPARPYFTQGFDVPLDTFITSIYGAKRIFNNAKQTQHLGTDFRAAVGVPIHTSNAGKVVVARDLFYTGYTVTIDHGLGIFTIYGHLSKMQAVEGEFVPKGALIGLSGVSGRVTGPHLHWGVKVNGEFIDGHSLVAATNKKEN